MSRVVTLAGYVLIVAAGLVCEARARRTGRATAAHAAAVVARSPAGKVVLLAGWLWLGWHLFARVGGR